MSKIKIIEIVGLAGAGKTTLYQALGCHKERICLENIPNVHNWTDAPFYVLNGIRAGSSLLNLPKSNSRKLTRREFAWMSILHGWPARLRKESNRTDRVILLDQGPVYLMAEMWLSGPEYLRQKNAERLWQKFYRSWSSTLHMVVWLDAVDDLLLDRIRNRGQEHIMKAESASKVCQFLDRYREQYMSILSRLRLQRVDLKVLAFDTGQQQTQKIVHEVLAELSCSNGK